MVNIEDLSIPRVYQELSTSKILTMEFLDGVKVSQLKPGSEDAKRLVKLGIETIFKQIFEEGLFHGDPHPGNLLALEDGRLGLIDFGLVGRLTSSQRENLVDLLVSIVVGDIEGLSRVVLKMGRPLGRVDIKAFQETLSEIRHRYLKNSLSEVDASLFIQDLIRAGQRFRIRFSPEYAILAKAAITVEGVGRSLDPTLDIVATTKPLANRLIRERFTSRQMIGAGVQSVLSLRSFVKDAPQHVEQLLMDLSSGSLQFQMRNQKLEEMSEHLNIQSTRILLSILSAGMFIAGAILLHDDPIKVAGFPVLGTLVFLLALFFGTISFVSHPLSGRVGRKFSLRLMSRLFSKRPKSDH
jgi:ubiquinone biosynthesis protein